MFHLGQKSINCIQLGQQLLDMTCGTSGWRENAERKKYWLVNYWKVQREPMGKVAEELKNNVGWGNRDMPENLVVELATSTMLESHRGLKNYKHQENHWTQKGAMKSKDRRELITKEEPRKSLVMYFKEVVTRLSFKRSWGTWTFLLPYFFCVKNSNQKHRLHPSCWKTQSQQSMTGQKLQEMGRKSVNVCEEVI